MSKYVIKNCPSYRNYKEYKEAGLLPPDENPYCYNKLDYCQNIADCVMKNIVEKCAAANKECNCTDGGKAKLTSEILDLLDIEECDDGK